MGRRYVARKIAGGWAVRDEHTGLIFCECHPGKAPNYKQIWQSERSMGRTMGRRGGFSRTPQARAVKLARMLNGEER